MHENRLFFYVICIDPFPEADILPAAADQVLTASAAAGNGCVAARFCTLPRPPKGRRAGQSNSGIFRVCY